MNWLNERDRKKNIKKVILFRKYKNRVKMRKILKALNLRAYERIKFRYAAQKLHLATRRFFVRSAFFWIMKHAVEVSAHKRLLNFARKSLNESQKKRILKGWGEYARRAKLIKIKVKRLLLSKQTILIGF